MTIVLVEQQIDRALDFAERVIVVERGRCVWEGECSSLKADHARWSIGCSASGCTELAANPALEARR